MIEFESPPTFKNYLRQILWAITPRLDPATIWWFALAQHVLWAALLMMRPEIFDHGTGIYKGFSHVASTQVWGVMFAITAAALLAGNVLTILRAPAQFLSFLLFSAMTWTFYLPSGYVSPVGTYALFSVACVWAFVIETQREVAKRNG